MLEQKICHVQTRCIKHYWTSYIKFDALLYLVRYQDCKMCDKNCTRFCVICQCDIEDEEDSGLLPCLHVHHQACLMEYMRSKIKTGKAIDCPSCRQLHYNVGSINYVFIDKQIKRQTDDVIVNIYESRSQCVNNEKSNRKFLLKYWVWITVILSVILCLIGALLVYVFIISKS
jgi:hypothetical protein